MGVCQVAVEQDKGSVVGSILDRIGNTPLIRINRIGREFKNVEIYAKAEWFNPGSSIKDRPALRMIQEAEKSGKLTKDKIILDATSGNTGIAYALIGRVKGYNVEMVMPESVCERRRNTIMAYRANIIFTDPAEGSDGAIREARRLLKENPDKYFYPDQYNNPANPLAHYETTGPEIISQTGGRLTHFVAGMGTSGTLMGTGRRLKEHNPSIEVIGVEPDSGLHGIEGLKHMASAIVPGIYNQDFLDEAIYMKTEDAYEMTTRLAEEEGLLVGHSSGAAMVGALRVASRIEKGVIVTIFPDSCSCNKCLGVELKSSFRKGTIRA